MVAPITLKLARSSEARQHLVLPAVVSGESIEAMARAEVGFLFESLEAQIGEVGTP
jgi:hypothetical protein